MNCRDCGRYDQEARVCKDGKLNPPRYEQANDMVKIFGLRVICPFNDHREKLIYVRSGPLTRQKNR
ncbi:MAG: hypothetical protein KF836_02915 [Fimbriimonadaceae bacterium]|nr:hypothetical protein [Fimbriimonadaceae bacterium]